MIEILLDDPWFLVINKPIDLLTQAPEAIPSVQSQLVVQLQPSMINTPFIGIPHRLDRMTSGVLVVARNQRALRRLCDQFAARTVRKEYVAWVEGAVEPSQGIWSDWIRKIPDVSRAECVEPDAEGGRIAELEYQVLARAHEHADRDVSLVRIGLKTGRMHQIRIQFGSRGHPVVGDRLYGGREWVDSSAHPTREPRLALHAWRLEFHHPKTAERVEVSAPIPSTPPWNHADWSGIAERAMAPFVGPPLA